MDRWRRALLAALAAALCFPGAVQAAGRGSGGRGWCATSPGSARDALWKHREQAARRGPKALASEAPALRAGQVAILIDEGDLALLRNLMDLQGAALRFGPAGAGYEVSRIELPLVPDTGARLFLSDDDSQSARLPFAFPFYGQSYSEVNVNSDGNLTFGQPDRASTPRTMGRLLGGPPRIAPLLADLDPASGGSVTTMSLPDRFIVTWTAVPQFEGTDKNTFQATLHPDGRVDFVYAREVSATIEEGVVGLAPGSDQGGLTAVDFSSAAGVSGGAGALAESFRVDDELDTVATARKFYRSFGDDYQQLVTFTNRRLLPRGSVAFESNIQNRVSGIGLRLSDHSAQFGSGGRLESFVMMDAVSRYPNDPNQRFLGADTTFSILGQETGHLWLAYVKFRDGAQNSNELLGRDDAHWSFFTDSDGSFAEGNEIEDLGGGKFKTGPAVVRYGPLDQYLMGLRPPEEVPPFFFVRNPLGTNADPSTSPREDVAFEGTRKDVTVQDVIAAMGPRSPAAGEAPRTLRQAFILVSLGGPPSAADLEKVERIRALWEPLYTRATEGRGTVDARLN